MSTETQSQTSVQSQALVKITEMDHIVLRNKDVEVSLRFYTEVLGMQAERVEQWRAGEVRFPSARINAASACFRSVISRTIPQNSL